MTPGSYEKDMKEFRDNGGLSTIEEVMRNDAMVRNLMRHGRPLEEIIVALYNRNNGLMKSIMEFESICPKKHTLVDGSVVIWHCPDHLVPERY